MEIIYIGDDVRTAERFYIRNDSDFASMIWEKLGKDAGRYADSLVDQIRNLEKEVSRLEDLVTENEDAYNDGYQVGYSEGYDSGVDSGYDEGYDVGYNRGYDFGSSD